MIGLAATPAAPPAAVASPAQRSIVRPASRVFPFLDLYYKLGPAKRTAFVVAYRWRAVAPGGGEWRAVTATLSTAGVETALTHSALGWFDEVPSGEVLAQRPTVRLDYPAGWRLSMIMAPQLLPRIGPQMDPGEVAVAAGQFERGIHAAGPLAIAVPHFGRVLFVGAQGASLVDAQGRSTPLTPVKGEVFATVASLKTAASLHFDTPPERVLLLPG